MKFECEKNKLSYGIYSLFQSDSPFFKSKVVAQTDEKSRGKTKGHKKPQQEEGDPAAATVAATTTRGGHWQAVLPLFSNVALCAVPWTAGLVLDHLSCTCWASFANFLCLIWPNLHGFLLTLGSIYVNMQPKTRAS